MGVRESKSEILRSLCRNNVENLPYRCVKIILILHPDPDSPHTLQTNRVKQNALHMDSGLAFASFPHIDLVLDSCQGIQ